MFDLSQHDITQFEAQAGAAAKLLRALANERRLMILCQLAEGERSGSPRGVPRALTPEIRHPNNGNALYVFKLPRR
jgi:DNA-binding transcriptional ArsR family regulator